MNGTHIKTKGIWTWLHRAVDGLGQTIDFRLSASRDAEAAKRFFRKALAQPHLVDPHAITVDENPACPRATREMKRAGQLWWFWRRWRCRCPSNIVQQDHRRIKRLVRPGPGSGSLHTAIANVNRSSIIDGMLIASTHAIIPFSYATPAVRVHWGSNCLDRLPDELARAGSSRAVIVCGKTLAQHPQGAPRLRTLLGSACVGVFDGVLAHSPVDAVCAAAEALRSHAADAVVALGGGSAVVTARAASVLLAEGGTVEALCTRVVAGQAPKSPRLGRPKLPQFAVPTTPTTALAKAGSAVIGQDGRRLTMFDPKTRARAVFGDPALLLTAGPALFRDAALNSFVMAMQGLESPTAHAMSDALLLHAVRLSRNGLPRFAADPQGVETRQQLVLAALLSGQGTDPAPPGLASVIGHCVGSRCGHGAGVVNAIMLPHTIRFNAEATTARLATAFGEAGGTEPDVAERVGEECARFFAALQLPSRLRDLGVPRAALQQIADDAQLDWFVRQNPRRVESAAEIMPLLDAAW